MVAEPEEMGKFAILDLVAFSVLFATIYSIISYSIGLALITNVLAANDVLPMLGAQELWFLIGATFVPIYILIIAIKPVKIDKLALTFRKSSIKSEAYSFRILPTMVFILFIIFGFLIFSRPVCEKSYCIESFIQLHYWKPFELGKTLYAFNKFTAVFDNSLALGCFAVAIRALVAQSALIYEALKRAH